MPAMHPQVPHGFQLITMGGRDGFRALLIVVECAPTSAVQFKIG
jgi:hypothetical protein